MHFLFALLFIFWLLGGPVIFGLYIIATKRVSSPWFDQLLSHFLWMRCEGHFGLPSKGVLVINLSPHVEEVWLAKLLSAKLLLRWQKYYLHVFFFRHWHSQRYTMGLKSEIWVGYHCLLAGASGRPSYCPAQAIFLAPAVSWCPPFYPSQDHGINAAPPSCAFPVMRNMTVFPHLPFLYHPFRPAHRIFSFKRCTKRCLL